MHFSILMFISMFGIVAINAASINSEYIGGCVSTQYGCCYDNVTSCTTANCTNCLLTTNIDSQSFTHFVNSSGYGYLNGHGVFDNFTFIGYCMNLTAIGNFTGRNFYQQINGFHKFINYSGFLNITSFGEFFNVSTFGYYHNLTGYGNITENGYFTNSTN